MFICCFVIFPIHFHAWDDVANLGVSVIALIKSVEKLKTHIE